MVEVLNGVGLSVKTTILY